MLNKYDGMEGSLSERDKSDKKVTTAREEARCIDDVDADLVPL